MNLDKNIEKHVERMYMHTSFKYFHKSVPQAIDEFPGGSLPLSPPVTPSLAKNSSICNKWNPSWDLKRSSVKIQRNVEKCQKINEQIFNFF